MLTIRHRDAGNHNGGTAAFGPDGKLWIATGDGGGGNDTFDNSSRLNELLGKLLRINPKKPENGDLGYRVPGKNPFVDVKGQDEIWSIGLRNPFRFSFDGDNITIGDVGQGAREEVDIVPIDTAKGADFQWPAREGTIEGPEPYRETTLPQIPPIHDYPRPVDPPDSVMRGVTVIGGVVVRDPRLTGPLSTPTSGPTSSPRRSLPRTRAASCPTSGRRRSPALPRTRSASTTSPELARTRRSACTSPRWPARCTGSIP